MARLSLIILLMSLMPKMGYPSLYRDLSSLEKSLVDEAIAKYALVPVENPEGKRIRNIFIYTASPFAKGAGILTILNYLHVNTKDSIILRDIFVRPGEIYESSVIKDSELSLRKRAQVRSISVIIPVNSESSYDQNEVDLLVATEDLLSLGLQFNLSGSSSNITNIMASLAENNFLGFNKSMSLSYEMQQGAHVFSSSYFDPGFCGSGLQLSLSESVLFLRKGFGYDGFAGEMRVGKPLLSQTDRWGYALSLKGGTKTVFDFQGGRLRMYDIGANSKKEVPHTYRYRYGSGSLAGTYSLGTARKKEFSLGYGFNVKDPSIPETLVLTPSEEQEFKKKLLPRDELESFITLGFSIFNNKFLTLYDYNNFRVQETLRLGIHFSMAYDLASRPLLLSDHSFFRPRLSLGFLQALGSDAFLSAQASTSTRFDGSFTDNTHRFGLALASPKILGLGRAVLAGSFAETINNRDNQKFVIGSDSGLRGVESRFYSGTKGFNVNLELRSAPIDLWILHAGFALFYDVGAAFDDWSKANATQALGFGLRFFAPQVSSQPFRIDIAFPIYGMGKNYHNIVPSFGVGQAF